MYSVLYVDDETGLLEIAKLFLESTGEFSVDTRISAQDGLHVMENQSYGAVVSDFQMPGMDGIEFLKEVRSKFGDLPFILFTGKGREEIVIQAINNGVDFYIHKGGDPRSQFAELAHKIKKAVERKSDKDALVNSEQRLNDIINFLPDATFAIDCHGTVIAWNRAIEEMTGVTASDMLGKGNYEYALPFYGDRHPVLVDLFFTPDAKIEPGYTPLVRKEGDVLNAETRLAHPLGRGCYLAVKATPLRDKNGTIVGAIESIRDITSQKTAETALLESEEKFRRMFDQSPVGAAIVSLDFRFQRVNEAFCRILGYTEEELRSKTFADITHPDHIAADKENMRRLGAGEIPEYSTEKRYIRKDGRIVWAELSVRQVKDANGQALYFLPMMIDITTRKEAELNLRAAYDQLALAKQELATQLNELKIGHDRLIASEARLQRAEMVAHLGHWSLSLDTGNMIASEGAGSIYGVKTLEMSVQAVQEIPLPEYRQALDAALNSLITGGKPYDLEFKIKRPDNGAVRDIHSLASYDPKHRVVFGIIHDITEIKQTEIHLRAMNEQLKAAEEELRAQYDTLAENQKSLAQSEEKYRTILENMQDVYYRTDSRGTLMIISPSGAALLGYADPQEMTGKEATDYYADPVQRDLFIATLKKDRSVSNMEISLKRKDGSPVTVSTSSHTYNDASGNYAGVEGTFRDITQLKQVQEELRQSEEQNRVLVAHTQDGAFIMQDGILRFCNEAFAAMIGYTPEEIIGLPIPHLISPEDRDMVMARHGNRLSGNSFGESYEFRMLHKDGITRVLVILSVGYGTFRNQPATIGTVRNVTRDREREHALVESEEKYRTLVDTTFDGIIIHQDGLIVFANATAVRLMRAGSADEMMGKPILSFVHPDCHEVVMQRMATANEEAQPVIREKFLRFDGSVIDVDVAGIPFTWKNKPAVHVVFHDITERKKYEEDLRAANEQLLAAGEKLRAQYEEMVQSETKFREIFNNVNDAVHLHEIDENGLPGKFIDLNDVACRMVQYTKDEMLQKSPLDFTTDYHSIPLRQIGKELNTRGHVIFETEYKRKDGTIFSVEINSHVVVIDGKKIVLSVVRDISERKKTEEAIRQANRKLNLLSSITRHDVANQLTVIHGYSQLAMIKGSGDPVIAEFLAKINTAVTVIQQQFEFTRMYQDLGVHAPVWHRIDRLVHDTPKPGLAITSSCGAYEIFADPMIGLIFSNLFDNAIRHGKKVDMITISCRMTDGDLVIYVEDNGVGVPANEKQKIFEKGYGKNTGLGLFLVQEILSITGITIKETGEPGKGARFEISVPKGTFRCTGETV